MSSLSHGRWITLAFIWLIRWSLFNYRNSILISFKFHIFIFYWLSITSNNYSPVVARYFTGRSNSRSTYINYRARLTLRNSVVYCIRNFFFLRFFWAFFHRRLSPNVDIGRLWPPFGIKVFNPFQVPLLNTIVLVSSGIRVTWAHHSLIEGNFFQTTQGLIITVLLGLYFTILQGLEYFEARFTFADRVYGSTFFIATGFHGLHVIVGTLFLIVILIRHLKKEFSSSHHFGFEAAAWYWHFVDVVWLFLYLVIYWWGRV